MANAATIATDQQMASVQSAATEGGDVNSLVTGFMNELAADMLAQGLSPEEFQAMVATAMQELVSAIPSDLPAYESLVADALNGGVQGTIFAVNDAVGADPNLDPVSFTTSATTGVATVVQTIAAANPGMDTTTLVAAVNNGALTAGASAIEPEAFEPAEDTAGATPDDTPADAPAAPADTPTVEAPPTQDDQDPSPV